MRGCAGSRFMSIERRKKLTRIRLEDAWVALWLPCLLMLVLSWGIWQRSATSHVLEVKLWAERPGVVQLFVDEGNGFSEQRSIRKTLEKAEQIVPLRFDLSGFASILNLRLDPMDHDGYVVLHALDYHQPGNWRGRSLLLPEYRIANSVRWQWNAAKRELAVYPAQGNMDPHFHLEGDFGTLSDAKILGKQWGQHLGMALTGLLVGWLLRNAIVASLVKLWMACTGAIDGLRRLRQAYTRWVDRISLRWQLVNPTSCVIAGLLLALYAYWLFADSALFNDREQRFAPELQFERMGELSSRPYAYLRTGDSQRYQQFMAHPPQGGAADETVRIALTGVNDPIRVVRIDPLEGQGTVELRNLRLVYADGKEFQLSWEGWTARGDAQIERADAELIVIRSGGADPYVVSPVVELAHRQRLTLPVRWVLPLVVFLSATAGLLLYNRLCTEDLTEEQIRNLQRS